MNKLLKNNLWWIVTLLCVTVSLSEVLVSFGTIGQKGITSYFAIIEVILSIILIMSILYSLLKKDAKFRILTIFFSLIMLVSLIVTFMMFSLPNAIAFEPLNKYRTLGASRVFWYRINFMVTDKNLQSGKFWLDKSSLFVNINLILSLVFGITTIIIFINQILRRRKYEKYD